MKVKDYIDLWHSGVVSIQDIEIHVDNILSWFLDLTGLSITLQLTTHEILVFYFATPEHLEDTWEYLLDSVIQSENFSDRDYHQTYCG